MQSDNGHENPAISITKYPKSWKTREWGVGWVSKRNGGGDSPCDRSCYCYHARVILHSNIQEGARGRGEGGWFEEEPTVTGINSMRGQRSRDRKRNVMAEEPD